MRESLHGHDLVIELDPTQIFPENPGEGTPVMVYSSDRSASGTYWCAVDTGELSCGRNVKVLTDSQVEWLYKKHGHIARWLSAHGG